MFKKFIIIVGICLASCSSEKSPYSPYSQTSSNEIYNMLFFDDYQALKPADDKNLTPWKATLFADTIDTNAVLSLANDSLQDGRVRYLAYRLLSQKGFEVPSKILLGVIIEVPLEGGLDVLASFSDGGVRYINQTGKMAIVEGGLTETATLVAELFRVSQVVVSQIGPWDKKRLPPPTKGNIRLSFLVSDGLYFGEGSFKALQQDAMSSPVLSIASQLMVTIVNATVN